MLVNLEQFLSQFQEKGKNGNFNNIKSQIPKKKEFLKV